MTLLSNAGPSTYGATPFANQVVFRPDQLIVGNLKLVTVAGIVAQTPTLLPRGTVLGRVTSTGKLVVSVATATDGSQLPCAITVDLIDASAGDVSTEFYVQGEFNIGVMSFDDSWQPAALANAFMAAPGNIYLKTADSNELI